MFYFIWALLISYLSHLTNADQAAAAAASGAELRPWRVDDLVQLFSNESARKAAVTSLLADVTRRATGEMDRVYRKLEGLAGQLGLAGSGSSFLAQLEGGDRCSCYCRCPRDSLRPADGKLAAVKAKMADVASKMADATSTAAVKSKMADLASKMEEFRRRFANSILSKTDGDVQGEQRTSGESDDIDTSYNNQQDNSSADYDRSDIDHNDKSGRFFSERKRKKRSVERSASVELAEERSELKSQLRELNSLGDKVDAHVKKIQKSFESIGESLKRALKHSTKLFDNVVKYGSKLKNKTMSAIRS